MKSDLPNDIKIRLAKLTAHTVTEYFKDPEHRKEFEEWYLKEYGEPYLWKIRPQPEDD